MDTRKEDIAYGIHGVLGFGRTGFGLRNLDIGIVRIHTCIHACNHLFLGSIFNLEKRLPMGIS